MTIHDDLDAIFCQFRFSVVNHLEKADFYAIME